MYWRYIGDVLEMYLFERPNLAFSLAITKHGRYPGQEGAEQEMQIRTEGVFILFFLS